MEVWFLLAVACHIGVDSSPTPVDVAEINTVCDARSDKQFTQVILWR